MGGHARKAVKARPHSRFIYITGCDGAGKTTQARLLVDQLRANGEKVKHLWLRFPFFISLPLLAYARWRGLSWRERNGGATQGYWDFDRSWLLGRVFPWALLLDAALASIPKIYLPLWLGYTVVCERFVLDMLVDQAIAFKDAGIIDRSPGVLYDRLIPKEASIFILDADEDTLAQRRADLRFDRRLHERVALFRYLGEHFRLIMISSNLPIETVNQFIRSKMAVKL